METAFFFDFDGTLAHIVDDPERVVIVPSTLAAVDALRRRSAGAVAIVSGRSMAQLDRMLQPMLLPLAGVHGLERRTHAGRTLAVVIDAAAQDRLAAEIEAFVAARPGLLAERKPGSLALHFRQRPELQDACWTLAQSLAEADPGLRIVPGKMVIEMMLAKRTKGAAIADFMAEPPFEGRRPYFAGDDVTDETGFDVVNRMGGISVKVGPGDTCAHYRIPDVDAFARHLHELAAPEP
jgi:trehalose 6-phosphate phosphatase